MLHGCFQTNFEAIRHIAIGVVDDQYCFM